MRIVTAHPVPLYLLLTFLNLNASAQTEGDLKEKKDRYHFNTAWTWEFSNEFEDVGGEMKVYVDTLTGTFLFTREAYGSSDMEADFIIADQEGTYLTGLTDVNGKKRIVADSLEGIRIAVESRQFFDEDFEKHTVRTGKKKTFGAGAKKGPVVIGEEYKFTFDPPTSFSLDYLIRQSFSLLPLYYFNQRRQAQARLPYSFSGALHMNYLLLENIYESDGKKISIVFRKITSVDKTVDLRDYQN
jgi:hypothetical protein